MKSPCVHTSMQPQVSFCVCPPSPAAIIQNRRVLHRFDLRGKFAKYDLKYLSLFSSFKNMAGMFGKGFRQINSPLSPSGNSFPSAEYTTTSMPRAFTASSPG